MNSAEQEQLYRDAMRARRAGERCPLCFEYHGALDQCRPVNQVVSEMLTPPLARTSDVETSHAAAAAGDKHALRFIVLAIYAEHPEGLVDDDLARLAGYNGGHESYRRRGSDLRVLGWTEWLMTGPDENEVPVKRETSLGAKARVAVITPLGRSVLANYRDAQA